jgi:hypothetical protein
MSRLRGIWDGDGALLAQVALAEGRRLAHHFAPFDPARAAELDTAWRAIAAWFGAGDIPGQPAVLYDHARRSARAALIAWRKEEDQSPAHPRAEHWYGLISIARQIELRLCLYHYPPQP